MDDIFTKIIYDVNVTCHIFLQVMKYFFSITLLLLGFITLIYSIKIYQKNDRHLREDLFEKHKVLLGFIYMIMGFGILFNFLLYPILWFLPEGFISLLINSFFQYYNPENTYLDTIWNIMQKNIFPILSFMALMNLTFSFYYYINKNLNYNPRRNTYWLISSIATGMLVGFSDSIPYLL